MGDKEQNVQSAPVWVVDDDHAIRWVLSRALSKAGIECRLFEEAESVLKALEDSAPMVLVSDIRMPGVSGVDLLARVKARMPNLPVIIMTAYSDLESAVSAFQGGAFEYLAKPFDITKAVELIERAMKEAQNMTPAVEAEAEQPASEESESQSVPDLIGQAPAMQEVFRAIGRLSHSLVTVLLTGESGPSGVTARGRRSPTSPSIWRPFRVICWRASFSAMKRERSRGLPHSALVVLSRRGAARSFSMKSATCRWNCRPGFCAF